MTFTFASRDELRPPTPPPAGWEEVVRVNRRFRLAIRVTLGAWIERALRNSLNRLFWAIADKKYYKEREQAVRSGLNRWFRDILIPVYAEWKEVSSQLVNMR